jgi:hypothetical protein
MEGNTPQRVHFPSTSGPTRVLISASSLQHATRDQGQMGRALKEIIAALPTERKERVEARYLSLKAGIERLHQSGLTDMRGDVMHRERRTPQTVDDLSCCKST